MIFLMIFSIKILNFSMKILDFSKKNLNYFLYDFLHDSQNLLSQS